MKKAQKNPKSRRKSVLNPALVVLNNFSTAPGQRGEEEAVAALTFPNIFPAVNVKENKVKFV